MGQVFNQSTQFCEDPINVPGCYFSFVNFYQVNHFFDSHLFIYSFFVA